MTETLLNNNLIELSKLLKQKSYKMATAESCTGGWVAKLATDMPGSSDWFDRGIVSYSNQSKEELLGVLSNTLNEYGAVSEQIVNEMVEGLLKFSSVSAGVAISGIAGPDGGTDTKPVGTVWIAWKILSQPVKTHCYLFSGNREQVRLQAVNSAVEGLVELLGFDQ